MATAIAQRPATSMTSSRNEEPLYEVVHGQRRRLAQFDLLIAAVARRRKLVLLTADSDFDALKGVRVRNWLDASR